MLTLSEWRKSGRPHVPVLIKEYMPSEVPPAGAALVWLLNGTGRFRTERRPLPEPHIARLFFQSALMLDDKDLLRYRCSECPTCPHLLEATGLSTNEVALADAAINIWSSTKLNSVRPRKWVKDYLPLLSLCEPGFYWVSVINHFPTDGSGRFFWSEIPADHPQNLLSFRWSARADDPAFLLPTQQTTAFNETSWNRAQETHQTHPGIALFLSGFGSALLDGHHRATAAAVAGRSFPCVTFKVDHVLYSYSRTFEAPLHHVRRDRARKFPCPHEANHRQYWPASSFEEKVPKPVETAALHQVPIPMAEKAQAGVQNLPTDKDWYHGAALREIFGGRITDRQWKNLLRLKWIRGDFKHPEFFWCLGLNNGLAALRVLDDSSWTQRWEQAMSIRPDPRSLSEETLNSFSPSSPFTRMFLDEFIARNEATQPDLIAELRQRYSLA